MRRFSLVIMAIFAVRAVAGSACAQEPVNDLHDVELEVTADGQPSSPRRFAGDHLPATPWQGRAWSPASDKVPKHWLSATAKLLEYGLADPRGCVYRQAELVVGSVWSRTGSIVKTHVFVLPPADEGDAAQRFAVAWNGLLYPLVTVGEPADLAADVAAIKSAPSVRQSVKSEQDAVSHESNDLVKCALLLVHGRDDLAATLLAALGEQDMVKDDPYLALVQRWIWFHYDRAICAHIRGDDVISLASARAARAAAAGVDKDAPLRGVARRKDIDDGPAPYIEFLGNIDLLIRDQERRVALNPVDRATADWQDIADPAERIRTLIRNLEFVDETQFSQPGAVFLRFSPIVAALANEGDAAVEPLIDCLESDDRLARSVSFGRDFHAGRALLSVGDAAYSTLTVILKTNTFGPVTEHGYHFSKGGNRGDAVRELREFWQRSKDLPEMERAFQILADDQATETQWLEAAAKLVNPVRQADALRLPEIARHMLPIGPAAGINLANKQAPSITELLVRRADSVAELDPNNTRRIHHLSAACQLTLHLAQWEPVAALQPIHKRLEQCRAMQNDRFFGPYAQPLLEPLTRLLTVGISQGDETLATEYADWLGDLAPEQVDTFRPVAPFLPLGFFPNNPCLANAAELALAAPDSPWRPLHEKLQMNWQELLNSPLVSVPAFQQLLAQELKNTAELGTISVNAEQRSMNVTLRRGHFGQRLGNSRDPDLPPDADPRPMRVCDFYAWRLSRLEGSPLFEPYWPTAKKDAAIEEFPEFLRKWGRCFQEYLPPWATPRYRGDPARFHLLKSDGEFLNKSLRPASDGDVAAGRAIFSLLDIGAEHRAVALTMIPHMARWKPLKQFPTGPNQGEDGAGEDRLEQAGYVWQAEEALIDGQWRRFYGFVGQHVIAKAPAEEIELIANTSEEPSSR
jgi:hypothetical protein